jgi:hypothetical protein
MDRQGGGQSRRMIGACLCRAQHWSFPRTTPRRQAYVNPAAEGPYFGYRKDLSRRQFIANTCLPEINRKCEFWLDFRSLKSRGLAILSSRNQILYRICVASLDLSVVVAVALRLSADFASQNSRDCLRVNSSLQCWFLGTQFAPL